MNPHNLNGFNMLDKNKPNSATFTVSDQLKKKLSEASKVGVLTGAGISAESGVPTFRGEHGLWKKFKPEELANFDAFIRNPNLVWEWYQYRRHLINEVTPNPGHYALAEMEGIYPEFSLITQNVDGLHQKAGSKNIHELHGNILRNRCIQCNRFLTELDDFSDQKVPTCQCGGLVRPDVVWYGEFLPEDVVETSNEVACTCDLFFSIGTSALVYPAASLPEIAKNHGAFVVEINPEPTPVSIIADEIISANSGIALPILVQAIKNHLN